MSESSWNGPWSVRDDFLAVIRKFDEQFSPPRRIISSPADAPSLFGMKVLISEFVPPGMALVIDERAMREAERKVADRLLEGLLGAERQAFITGSIGAVPFALSALKPQPAHTSHRRAARRRHSHKLKRTRA